MAAEWAVKVREQLLHFMPPAPAARLEWTDVTRARAHFVPEKGGKEGSLLVFLFFFGERKANLRTCVSAVSESGESVYVTRLLCREKSTIWIIGWYFWIACLNRVPRSLFFLP